MVARYYDLHGVRVVEMSPDAAPLRSERDAVGVMSQASAHDPELIVLSTGHFDEEFFRLRTGIAGQFIQKFLTYRLRLAIVGDISEHLQESSALRDFVYECNSGSHVWFLGSIDELGERLQRAK